MMKFEIKQIKIKDVVSGYVDDPDKGVYALDGKLCCRPAYQREFCYKDKQREAVIESILKNRPLNLFYWAVNADGDYELMDGQQRTLSICQYINGEFAIDFQYFFNLSKQQQEQIYDYEIMVYVCSGADNEVLDWFRTINIAGEKLTDQELLNAVYSGSWVTDAKRYFSKPNCAASQLAADYMAGNPIRQDYFHKVLEWVASSEGTVIADYMAKHQHDTSANALWMYFQSVISWVKMIFPNYRKTMKGLEWGLLYNKYKGNVYNSDTLEKEIQKLEDDEEVTNAKGIFEYLLSGNEKHLNIRVFDEKMKQRKYKEQAGVCPKCNQHFEYKQMDGDHILPWAKGGKTEYSNLQMLCIACNRGGR